LTLSEKSGSLVIINRLHELRFQKDLQKEIYMIYMILQEGIKFALTPSGRRTFSPRKQRLKALLKDDQAVLSIKIRNPEGKTTETSQENRNCKQINQQLQV